MKNKIQLAEMLNAWEEIYKKGQLTFWIFLSLKDGKKYVEEIKTFVEENTQGTMQCELQSLYRNLRKYNHIGVVDFEMGIGNRGPERKYYYLTPMGKELLILFIRRNINLFYNKQIINIIKMED